MMAAGRSAAMLIAVTAAICPLVFAGAGRAAAAARMPAGAGVAALGGTWHTAIPVPGTRGDSLVSAGSVSCSSAGNCGVGGVSFLDSEVSGRWHTAIPVPGTGADSFVGVYSVSCSSAGNCGAVGSYGNSENDQVFAVSEVRGRWDTATKIPGIAALDKDGSAGVNSVSCASAGNCSAGGYYTDRSGNNQGFVVNEVRGRWGTAIEVPGFAALNKGGYGAVYSVSCGSAGNCSADGLYAVSDQLDAFVVSEVRGRWGTAIEVPGTAALNKGDNAGAESVSCASAGNCSAGGYYTDRSGDNQAFVVSEVRGRWGTAIEVPGFAALNKGSEVQVDSVSCASAGNCSAGGYYTDRSVHAEAFVVSEVRGRWGTAIEVPGTAALNKGGNAEVDSVSCASAGNCSAGGYYVGSSAHSEAFVVSEVRGRWGTAIEVPGTAALNKGGYALVDSVSCGSAGNCSADGIYTGSSGDFHAFVVSETQRS